MTVFFRVGDFQLTAYGLCILAGALAGGLLCLRKKEVLPALAPTMSMSSIIALEKAGQVSKSAVP